MKCGSLVKCPFGAKVIPKKNNNNNQFPLSNQGLNPPFPTCYN